MRKANTNRRIQLKSFWCDDGAQKLPIEFLFRLRYRSAQRVNTKLPVLIDQASHVKYCWSSAVLK